MEPIPPDRISISSSSLPESRSSSRRTSVSSIYSVRSELWVKYLPANAASPELCPFTWKQIRGVLFPVEILFLLAIFCYFFFDQIYQQYFFQHLAKAMLLPNSSHQSMCYNQSYITNKTSNSSFKDLQESVNKVNMAMSILYLSLTGIVSLILGPLSDVIGRKPTFLITLVGIALASFWQVFIVHLNLDPHTYFASAIFFGLFGGHATFISLSLAAVTDTTTSSKWLIVRIGLIQVAIILAKATSSAALNNWIDSSNCDFRPPIWLMFFIVFITFIYWFLMAEPLKKRQENQNKLNEILNGFKCFLIPQYIGIEKWWRLLVSTTIISLELLTVTGGSEIITYFLHNKPLEWSYREIGIYEPVAALAKGFSLVVILPLLVVLKFSNALLCLIASLFTVATYIVMANVKYNWEMYLAGIFQGVSYISFPAIRTILAQLVPPKYLGAIFSITQSLQKLASIGSTVLFNEVYRPQVTVNGHTENPGIVFWITAGIWFAAIPLILLLLCCKMKPSKEVIPTVIIPQPVAFIDDGEYLIISQNTLTQNNYGSIQ